jgi:hypothetical protein
MSDALLSAVRLLDRLAREEQQLKRLGLHAQAAGIRIAITILIREQEAGKDRPPLDPST